MVVCAGFGDLGLDLSKKSWYAINTMNTASSPSHSFQNPDRISVVQLATDYGYNNTDDFIQTECSDSVVPACCRNGCEVEPDGKCEHGCPSPLLALSYI